MNLYEIVDLACDAINPALFFIVTGFCILFFRNNNKRAGITALSILLYGLIVTYSVLFIDRSLSLWSNYGHDYSTHAAFTLATCSALFYCWRRPIVLSFGTAAYFVVMVLQEYHSAIDIVTTTLVVGPLLLIAWVFPNVRISAQHRD